MLKGFLNWLSGWCVVTIPAPLAKEGLNCLKNGNYVHWKMQRTSDGMITVRMTLRDASAYVSAFSEGQCGTPQGLPALLRRYRGRYGILLGVVLFAFVVWQSLGVVWSVEVTGNRRLSEEKIVEMLSDYGFGVGSRFSGVDFDILQNDFLLTTDEIAWIAVNMEGTVAKVEVRETENNLGKTEKGSRAANVVAAEDGQILEVRRIGGRAVVQRGDIVRKGDLLISGILTIREEGLRYEYGGGEVFAQVNRVISVEIPCERIVKVLTGREIREKSIRFFDKEIKLFGNSGIVYTNYDTIEMNRQLFLPGGVFLPLWIETRIVRETGEERIAVSESQAMAEAMTRYRSEMDLLLSEGEVLSLETEKGFSDGVYRIVTKAVCRVDIARTAEIPLE